MRIALVCPYSLDVPGGVGTHVLGEASWLAGQGHEVIVIAPGRPAGTIPGAGLAVHRLGGAVPFTFNGSVAHLAVLPGQARRARRALAGADVVHVHEPLTPGIAFAAARAASSLVVTHHASFTPPPVVATWLRRRSAALGNRTSIAVSPSAARTASIVTGIAPEVIPNAIQIPAGELGDRHRTPGQVLFLGRARDKRKGFASFCSIAQDLGSGFTTVAAGPGTQRAPQPVRGLGEITAAQRSELLTTSDILVAPNLGGESFGLVLAEAMAAGCGVVASDIPGFRQTLATAHDGCAQLFEPGDVLHASARIRSMSVRGVDRRAARQHAGQWSWDVVGPRLLEVLQHAGTGT